MGELPSFLNSMVNEMGFGVLKPFPPELVPSSFLPPFPAGGPASTETERVTINRLAATVFTNSDAFIFVSPDVAKECCSDARQYPFFLKYEQDA